MGLEPTFYKGFFVIFIIIIIIIYYYYYYYYFFFFFFWGGSFFMLGDKLLCTPMICLTAHGGESVRFTNLGIMRIKLFWFKIQVKGLELLFYFFCRQVHRYTTIILIQKIENLEINQIGAIHLFSYQFNINNTKIVHIICITFLQRKRRHPSLWRKIVLTNLKAKLAKCIYAFIPLGVLNARTSICKYQYWFSVL